MADPYAPSSQTILVREEKRPGGKLVTVASGFRLGKKAALEELARALKTLVGAGGTARGDVIELQGRHAEVVAADLQARGFRVKRG
jgi:translation initiation factor 1